VSLRTEADEVRIVVEDDGPGIEDDRLDRVFEPGVTTKASGDRAARGIGLALVSRIARRRGGWAAATSPASGGARLEVRLQAIQEPVVPA
jgi:two-component system CitB family sensor kinase